MLFYQYPSSDGEAASAPIDPVRAKTCTLCARQPCGLDGTPSQCRHCGLLERSRTLQLTVVSGARTRLQRSWTLQLLSPTPQKSPATPPDVATAVFRVTGRSYNATISCNRCCCYWSHNTLVQRCGAVTASSCYFNMYMIVLLKRTF